MTHQRGAAGWTSSTNTEVFKIWVYRNNSQKPTYRDWENNGSDVILISLKEISK